MPYRQGTMAAGDYYGLRARGDGLFGFIGKALGSVAKVGLNLIPGGGLAGGLIKAGAGILSSPAGRAAVAQGAQIMYPGIGGAFGAPRQNPIGATLPPPPMLGRSLGPGVVVKPRKGAWEPTEVVPRRSRRMNVTNPKALRRAIRRARGFEKMARKVLGFTSPRKPKGRTYFKARAKR